MAISSPGLGSGLDVTGIVSQLMAVERQPLLRLGQKEARVQAAISAYGSLKGALSTLQSSLSSLKQGATYQATNASASDQDVLKVSSNTEAVASSYSVTINRLAQPHKLGSAEFDATATFGGGVDDKLTLTAGEESFTLDLSAAMTLGEIQQAINADDNGTGITAGLITGDSGHQTLVLTSGKSGNDDRVQLSFGGALGPDTFGFSMLNRGADDQLLAAESELDASLSVDGVTVTRGSNSITDVVDGLTLNLQATGHASVSISKNTAVARSAVQGFVNAYNTLKGQFSTLTANGASSSLMRGIESQLRGVLNNGLSGLGSYAYLSELGVTTNADTGKLQLDSGMLTSALEENPNSVSGFFSDEADGFAVRMEGLLEGFVRSGGTIDSIVGGANSRIGSLGRNRESLERRLEGIEQRYLKQFGALDTLMASMSTTSEYLTSQLDMLSNLVSRNNN